MLQPTNRLTLIDAMRPPAGFGFDEAMAVTFTLDLRALLAAPAAFALSWFEGDSDTDDPGTEPIELLHSIRTHAKSITVFSHAGEIALPPSRRIFAFLEQCVVPVTAPNGGVVHPKVWVLRYSSLSDADATVLRILSSSRNLTFDASWDTLLRLEQGDDGAGCSAAPVADMFEQLVRQSVGTVARSHLERVASLCTQLRGASFVVPDGVDDLRFHVLGLAAGQRPLPEASDRSLIVSPFVSDEFIAGHGPVDDLISRQEALDGLSDSSLETIANPYVFDDGSNPDLNPREDELSAADPGRPLRGIHAKLFVYEIGDRAHVFAGSANATGAAFGRNVEVLAELIGPIRTLGIEQLTTTDGDELGFEALFQPYSRSDDETIDEEPGSLDSARRALGSIAIDAVVEQTSGGWAVTYRTAETISPPSGTILACWPLSTPGNRHRVPTGQALDERFEGTIESISGFLAFELSDDEADSRTTFVIPVNLIDVPEERERNLLRIMIGNAERFLRYLIALLSDDAGQMDLMDALDQVAGETGDRSVPGTSLPVLEKMLRALRRDPGKLLALNPLVTDLAAEDALPPGFMDLWTTIHDAAVGAGDVSK